MQAVVRNPGVGQEQFGELPQILQLQHTRIRDTRAAKVQFFEVGKLSDTSQRLVASPCVTHVQYAQVS